MLGIGTKLTSNPRPFIENLFSSTEEFNNVFWSKVGVTITDNDATAPNGSLTADKLVEDTSTGLHYLFAATTLTGKYTTSFFVNADEYTTFRINGGSALYDFDLVAETSTNVGGSTPAGSGIRDVGDGWFRCWVVSNRNGTAQQHQISLIGNYTGDGTSGIHIWGAMLNEGDKPALYNNN